MPQLKIYVIDQSPALLLFKEAFRPREILRCVYTLCLGEL